MSTVNLSASLSSLQRFATTDPECRSALERVRPILAALAASAVTSVNGDIPTMASIALGAHPDCVRYRDELAALPGDYARALDALPDAARAAVQAQADVAATATPDDETATLADECLRAREMLATALFALADHGYADAQQVHENLAGKSRLDLGRNTLALVTIFEKHWPSVGSKTAVTADELRLVRVLAERLLESVGVKEHGPLVPQEAIDLRDRAFSYFTQTYAKVRRAIRFVRDEAGDGDTIAPSLWSRNAPSSRSANDHAGTRDTTNGAPATSAVSTGGSVSTAVAASASVAAAAAAGVPQNRPFEA